jgi:predicted SPOUT superfamily RNA methylase MTH1
MLPAVRQKFTDELPTLSNSLASALDHPTPIPITVSIPHLYAYATQQWQKESFGSLMHTYIEKLIEGIEKYTDSGKDKEALGQLKQLLPNPSVTIRADGTVDYCATKITPQGDLEVVFKPDYLGYNLDYVANLYNLTQLVDESKCGASTSTRVHQ